MKAGDIVYLTQDVLTSTDEEIGIPLKKGTELEYRLMLPKSNSIMVLYSGFRGIHITFAVEAHQIVRKR